MHLSAKLVMFLLVAIALFAQATAAFQAPSAPEPSALQPSREADRLVMRALALEWLNRSKEVLDLAEAASADVNAQLAQYIHIQPTSSNIGLQRAVENARVDLQKYSSVPANLTKAHIILGEYDAAVKTGGDAIRFWDGALSSTPGDKRVNYLLLSDRYTDRAIASSAAGNRVGSQRDFQTALELCRKADCERLPEADIYFKRALSSFLLGDLSPAGNDCRSFSQFGPIYASARQQEAENICAYILSPDTSAQISRSPAGGLAPTSAPSTSSGENIRAEIDEIKSSGRFASMPAPVRIGSSATGDVAQTVENATTYELRVLYSGPVDRELVIPAGVTANVSLPVGEYRVAAKVSNSSVLPYYGVQTYPSGSYSSRFYVQ